LAFCQPKSCKSHFASNATASGSTKAGFEAVFRASAKNKVQAHKNLAVRLKLLSWIVTAWHSRCASKEETRVICRLPKGNLTLFTQTYNSSNLFKSELGGEAKRLFARTPQTSSISVAAEAQHLSQLIYAIPPARVKALLPRELLAKEFAPVETLFKGRSFCWLSIISYSDQSSGLLNSARGEAFEQTFYRLLLARAGQPFQWLFHTTVGSLDAISARLMWALPWHLGAMEFQLGYDVMNHRYQTYRLQSQSEFVNAYWEIADTGETLSHAAKQIQPSLLLQPTIEECFVRRAGGIGLRQIRFRLPDANRGQLRQARCDLLARLGLLTQAELLQPAFALLGRAARFELAAPIVLTATGALAAPLSQAA
jgi:hypothetical protein